MSEVQKSNSFSDVYLTAEEFLGPPKIDVVGLGLMIIMSIVVGFLAGVGVLIFSFLTSGQFSIESGVSPILLAMITFFCLTFANYIYVWGLSTIFPHIYSRVRTMFMQVSIFSGALYIVMTGLYFAVSVIYTSPIAILGAFGIHVVTNIFGLLLLTGIIAQYRYSILVFYANFLSFVITGLIVLWIYASLSESGRSIFFLMGLIATSFFVFTTVVFSALWGYYQFYKLSGSDPFGDVFGSIEKEEKDLEKQAEKSLLTKN